MKRIESLTASNKIASASAITAVQIQNATRITMTMLMRSGYLEELFFECAPHKAACGSLLAALRRVPLCKRVYQYPCCALCASSRLCSQSPIGESAMLPRSFVVSD